MKIVTRRVQTTGDHIMNKTELLVAVLCGAAFLCGSTPAAEPAAAAPARSLTWRTEEGSVALLCNGKMVWQHVHDRSAGKPYMRLALLDGTELTNPWSIPSDYPTNSPARIWPWHRGLWWSWKYIDGLNVWDDERHGNSFATNSQVERHDDGSAVIAMEVVYGPNVGPPLVNEKRTVSVGAPDTNGMYLVEWEGVFTPAGAKDVFFKKWGYGGFAMRCAASRTKSKNRWQFFDHEGRLQGQKSLQGHTARWLATTGTITTAGDQKTREATVAIFDHPSNPRHPVQWFILEDFFCLPFTGAEEYTLKAGTSLTLRYGVLIVPVKLEAAAVERHWKMFSERKVEHAKPR
jgi:hypothetical protein